MIVTGEIYYNYKQNGIDKVNSKNTMLLC